MDQEAWPGETGTEPAGGRSLRLGALLFQAHLAARQAANEAMREHGVELRDLGVLQLLNDGRTRSQQEIGAGLDIDKSAMVRVVDALEGRGLVARRRREDDRRAYAISITDAGRTCLRDARGDAARAMDALLKDFTEGDRSQLGRLLERLVRAATAG